MRKGLLCTLLGSGIALVVSFSISFAVAPGSGIVDPQASPYTLEGTLEAWTVQSMDNIQVLEDGSLMAVVELDRNEYVLSLEPHSMRSPDFAVQVQVEGGALIEVEPPAPATYRGTVLGVPESRVAASFIDGQLSAMIDLGDGEIWFVEPLSQYDAQAKRSDHVVYRASDSIPQEGICATGPRQDLERMGIEPRGGALPGGGVYEQGDEGVQVLVTDELTDIAFDADYEFYQKNGSSVGATVLDIENVMNGVEEIYQRDTQICYNLTHIIVRSNINDPYTSNDPETLLNQFRSEWNAHEAAIQRDTAHLMTGRNMNGSVIGISWLSVICSFFYGYGLSESRYTTNYNNRITLTAHEIGHNWSAEHCNGIPDCHIMCASIGGCAGIGLPNFGTFEVGQITAYRDTRPCLDAGCGSTLDLIEPDPGVAGQQSTVGVRGATPGGTVQFFWSFQTGSTEVPGCPGVFLSLGNARGLTAVTADNNGDASITLMVPGGAAGHTVYLQAADESICDVSDVEVYTFPN